MLDSTWRLKKYFTPSGLAYRHNRQPYNVPGRTQSPYRTRTAVAVPLNPALVPRNGALV